MSAILDQFLAQNRAAAPPPADDSPETVGPQVPPDPLSPSTGQAPAAGVDTSRYELGGEGYVSESPDQRDLMDATRQGIGAMKDATQPLREDWSQANAPKIDLAAFNAAHKDDADKVALRYAQEIVDNYKSNKGDVSEQDYEDATNLINEKTSAGGELGHELLGLYHGLQFPNVVKAIGSGASTVGSALLRAAAASGGGQEPLSRVQAEQSAPPAGTNVVGEAASGLAKIAPDVVGMTGDAATSVADLFSSKEERLQNLLAQGRVARGLNQFKQGIDTTLGGKEDSPIEATANFLGYALPGLGAEKAAGSLIAKAADATVENLPRAVSKVAGAAKASVPYVPGVILAASGHPVLGALEALGIPMTRASRVGRWVGRLVRSMKDGAPEAQGELSRVFDAMNKAPNQTPIFQYVKDGVDAEIERLKTVETTLRDQNKGKLVNVDNPAFDMTRLKGADAEVRAEMDKIKRLQEWSDRLDTKAKANAVATYSGKRALTAGGNVGLGATLLGGLSGAGATPGETEKAAEQGASAGAALSLSGAPFAGADEIKQSVAAAKNAPEAAPAVAAEPPASPVVPSDEAGLSAAQEKQDEPVAAAPEPQGLTEQQIADLKRRRYPQNVIDELDRQMRERNAAGIQQQPPGAIPEVKGEEENASSQPAAAEVGLRSQGGEVGGEASLRQPGETPEAGGQIPSIEPQGQKPAVGQIPDVNDEAPPQTEQASQLPGLTAPAVPQPVAPLPAGEGTQQQSPVLPSPEQITAKIAQGNAAALPAVRRARSPEKKAQIARTGRLDALKTLIPTDGVGLRPVVDPVTEETSWKGDVDLSNPLHQAILDEFGYTPEQKANLIALQAVKGRGIYLRDYNSAAQEGFESGGAEFTGEQRGKEYAASPTAETGARKGDISKQDKPFTPLVTTLTNRGVNMLGFDHDKFLSNVRAVLDAAKEQGVTTGYEGLKAEKLDDEIAADFRTVAANHSIGWNSEGTKKLQIFPDMEPAAGDTIPQKVDPNRANVINMALANESAKPPTQRGETDLAKKKYQKSVAASKQATGLAELNQGFLTPTGETNPLRDQLNAKGFDSKKTLKPTISAIRPDLIGGGVSDSPSSGKSVHAHGFDVPAKELTFEGLPDQTLTAAGTMPATKAIPEVAGDFGTTDPIGVTDTLAELDKRAGRAPQLPTPMNKVEPSIPKVAETSPTGNEWAASTPLSNDKVAGHWQVTDLPNIITSDHPKFPQELQPRDRTRIASKQQVAKIASELEPARLGESPTTETGAPIIDESGNALTGNGRLAALRQVYGEGSERAAAYRDFVLSRSSDLGIDPAAIEKLQSPVLVRQINDYGELSKPDFARLSNESSVLGMSTSEKALSDAQMLRDNPAVLNSFAPSEEGDIMAARNREFLNSFVNGTGDQAELLNADGSHNAKALVPRVKNAVMGALIGAENRSLMNDLIDRPQELGIAKAVDGVMRAAPRLMKHNGGPFDLGTALHQALLDLVRIRGEGTKVDDFLAQSTLFADPHRTAESDFLLRQLATGKSANQIAEGLTKYAEMADHIDVTTGDIFGEPLTPRPELLERSYAKPNEEQQQENLAFGKSQSAAGGPEKETLAAQKSIPSVGEDENPHLQEEPPETTVPRGSIPDLRGTEGTGDQGAAVATKARSVSDLRQQFAQQVDQAVVARRSLGTYLRGEAVRLRSAEDLGPRASKFASELLDNFAEDIEQSGHLPLTLQRPIYRADYNAHAADYDRAATAANKALSDGLTALNLTQEELQGPNAPSREVRGIPGIPSIESGDAPPTAPAPKVAEPSPPPKEKVATKKKKRRSFTIRKTRTDEEAA